MSKSVEFFNMLYEYRKWFANQSRIADVIEPTGATKHPFDSHVSNIKWRIEHVDEANIDKMSDPTFELLMKCTKESLEEMKLTNIVEMQKLAARVMERLASKLYETVKGKDNG